MKLYRNCVLSAFALMLVLCAGHIPAQEAMEPSVSAGFGGIGFLTAIHILERSANGITINFDASLCASKAGDMDPKKVDVPDRVSLSVQDQPIGKALQALLNKAYTPLTYRRTGSVYTIIADPARKPAPHARGADAAPLPGAKSVSFINTPFDEAIDSLCRTYQVSYVIQPDVPVTQESVTIAINNARVEDAMAALLSSLSKSKTSLISRYEGGKYVISIKEGASPALLPNTLPNGGWDIDLTGIPLEKALKDTFHTRSVNYFFVGSINGGRPVVIQRHFDSEEAAIVAILRSAQVEPMRIYRKEGNLVIMRTTISSGVPTPTEVTCHCANVDFATVARAIFVAFHKSNSIDLSLMRLPITLSIDHASFDDAIQAIRKVLPPNSVHIRDNRYEFGK